MRDDTDSEALTCLVGIRTGRARFFDAVVAHASEHAPASRRLPDGALGRDYLSLLRSDGAALVAEFFFLIEELGLRRPGRFRAYAESHNAAMERYLSDRKRMGELGLTPQRVKAAMFSEDQIAFIEFVSPEGQLLIDQTSLGRLLTEAIAPESCRKVVIALAEGGLLQRQTLRNVLIRSDGLIEGLYRSHLMTVVEAVKGINGGRE